MTTTTDFRRLLARVAEGWNTGDAEAAAACFAADAVYVEPPDRQRYVGRQALREFFAEGDPPGMRMTWHNVAFDEGSAVGFGEYTFALTGVFTAHGIVVVGVSPAGEIASWREYQYESELSFEQFAGDSLRRAA